MLFSILATSLTIIVAALATEVRHGQLVQGVQIILGGLVFLAPALVALVRREREPMRVYQRMLKTPFFYCWVGLLVLLCVQYTNAGRELVFSSAGNSWAYASPRWPALPSAFSKNDVSQLLSWFLPAGAIGAVLSSLRLSRGDKVRALKWITIPAALLGFGGLIQWLLSDGVRLIKPSGGFFVSGFGYANHAGAFFLLMLGPALGLLFHALRGNDIPRPSAGATLVDAWRNQKKATTRQRQQITLYALVAVGCFVGTHVSMSRAAIIASWIMVLSASGFALKRSWHAWPPAQRLLASVATVMALCGAFFIVHGTMHVDLDAEMESLKRDRQAGSLNQMLNGALLGNRPLLRQASVMIWRDSPLFGAGAWSLGYLAPLKLNSGYEPMLGEGTASAHCDPLQYLSEFGLVGMGCLVGMFASLLVAARRKKQPMSSLRFCLMLGTVMLLLYSFIDLPFRHPAILCAWFAIAALGGKAERQKAERLKS